MRQSALRRSTVSGHSLKSLATAAALLAGLSACATPPDQTGTATPTPAVSAQDLSTSGAYLAARHADRIQDVRRASSFMDQVLASEGGGIALKRRTFLLRLEDGRYEDAARLAGDVSETLDSNAPIANIFLAVEAARTGKFDDAAEIIARLPDNRLNRILRPLLAGWIELGRGDREAAEAAIGAVREIDGFAILHALHLALVAESVADIDDARQRFDTALHAMPDPPLRLRLTAAQFLARQGELERAVKIALVDSTGTADPRDIRAHLTAIAADRSGHRPSAAEGLAQAFFDLGSALQRDRRSELAMVFARLALRLDPQFDLACLLVAEILDDREQHGEALELYDMLPDTSAYRLMAQLRAVSSLVDLGRVDDAVARLTTLAQSHPNLTDPLVRLGDLHRSHERWDQAIAAYDQAVARVQVDRAADWSVYYARGIALERSARWDRAEADFLKALDLRPEQPYVLNYLGYTWVDQGRNLPRATAMIERAVALRPNDGYIVDSLGWAMYRQSRYLEAVLHLERAVELQPTDPTINDHLGDAYWQVGRKQEARFQWHRALNFGAEAELASTIEQKLEAGLPDRPKGAVKTAGVGSDAEG